MKLTIFKTSILFAFLALLSCSTDNGINEPALPEVATEVNENGNETIISYTSIEITGAIVSDGGSEISSYGVVWGTEPDPTLEDNVFVANDLSAISNSNKLKTDTTKQSETFFTAKLTDLEPGTEYFFRVYATNDAGTAYGNQISLSTAGLEGTTWSFTFNHREDYSWNAEVEFFADGRAFYTEPEYPGIYDQWGTWSLDGNMLIYDMIPNIEGYVVTGELVENAMSGTYTYAGTDGTILTWNAVQDLAAGEEVTN